MLTVQTRTYVHDTATFPSVRTAIFCLLEKVMNLNFYTSPDSCGDERFAKLAKRRGFVESKGRFDK